MFFWHLYHYFYIPQHQAWYTGNIWGNVFVIAVVAPLGWIWSKTKFWPLVPLHRAVGRLHEKVDGLHAKHDAHAEEMAKLHVKIDALHKKHDELHKALAGGTGPETSNLGG